MLVLLFLLVSCFCLLVFLEQVSGFVSSVCFLAEASSPSPFSFYFGGEYLMLVIFCSVAIGVDFAFVLLGSIWRIVIVLIGCINESSVIVCWPSVCMFVIFVKWDGHVCFLVKVGSPSPLRFYCGGGCMVVVLFSGVTLDVALTCVVNSSICRVVIIFTCFVSEAIFILLTFFVLYSKVYVLLIYM